VSQRNIQPKQAENKQPKQALLQRKNLWSNFFVFFRSSFFKKSHTIFEKGWWTHECKQIHSIIISRE